MTEPNWYLTVERNDLGVITSATFKVDIDPPVETPREAMRRVTSAGLWWLDTGQDKTLVP